jgi:hypothetical protein
MSHYYLYAECKTDGCPGHHVISHFEGPDLPHFFQDYPDEALHLELWCEGCGQTHRYAPEDMKTKSSVEPMHPEGWQPIVPFHYLKPSENN